MDIEQLSIKQANEKTKKEVDLENEESQNRLNAKSKYIFKGSENGVIIQSYTEKDDPEPTTQMPLREITSTTQGLSNSTTTPNKPTPILGREFVISSSPKHVDDEEHRINLGDIVSEIKISSSPNSEEAEAMVASTLLTVSSRVRDRLRNKEKAALKLHTQKEKLGHKQRDRLILSNSQKLNLKNILTKNTDDKHEVGSKNEQSFIDMSNSGNAIEEENDQLRDIWRPVTGLMEAEIWSE